MLMRLTIPFTLRTKLWRLLRVARRNWDTSFRRKKLKSRIVEVSGRKGFGVKADDLIDKLEAATLSEVQQRHADMDAPTQQRTAHEIAVGALRFFLLKFTRNATIAFDFKDALSFEGETGPYCQYAVVRIRGIRRKGVEAGATKVDVTPETVAAFFQGRKATDCGNWLLMAGSLDAAVDAAITGRNRRLWRNLRFNWRKRSIFFITIIIFFGSG